MDSIRWKSLVIIKDTLQYSGEKLWASLVHSAIGRNKGPVSVYLLTSCKKTLLKRYPFLLKCIAVEEVDSVDNIFHKIPDILKNVEGATIFLDSIDAAFLDNSFDRIIVLLREISRYATVIARIHDECISVQNWNRLSSVFHMTCSLELRNTTPFYTVISYKNDGSRIVKVGTVHIDDSFHSSFKQYKAQDVSSSVKEKNNLLIPESSFDIGLHLKKSELEAKKNLSLPYEAAQKEEELVRLRVKENQKIRAGGRIIYTPDEADDLDESDPDDDLEI
uniref:Elongator complex protein 5 n=1 Tax=Setaria digitata TaxID=48799 RepID=A0A915PIR7_9BILA